MCGITGIVEFEGAPVEPQVVQRMTDVLSHRGPDDQGIHCEPGVGLGHRRLAIIDLSPCGHQPMATPDEMTWIVFNGEIYNFRALRAELEQHGHRFKSSSDTEVLLAGYRQWGGGLWNRLDGFFAVALWDRRDRSLTLVRDAFGIKPLFYAAAGGRVLFGSEIKALLASGLVARDVDLQSLSHYLTYFYTPGPDAIIRGVRQVGPGEVIRFTRGGMTSSRFWELRPAAAVASLSEDQVAEALREECRMAVQSSLEADVPVGLLLSGGMDSNIILHELKKVGYPDIRAVTVGFREKSFDEAAIAEHSLRSVGLKGHTTYVEDHDAAAIFDRMIYHVDSLNANVANLAEWHIFRVASTQLKVALAGMGNDELFAGYSTYLADKVRPYYRALPSPLRHLLRYGAGHLPPSGRKYGFDFLARKFTQGAEFDAFKSHYWWRTVFTPDDQQQLFRPEAARAIDTDSYALYDRHYRRLADAGDTERILFADMQMFCIDNANVLMDGMSMAFAVEVRPPFLSKRFVEFAFGIPYRMKIRGTQTKHILRKAYEGRLPERVTGARKTGLVSPLAQLLRGDLRTLAQESFAAAGKHAYLDASYCQRLLNEHLSGRHDHSLPLYVLLNYFRWYDRFIEGGHERIAHAGAA
jgi:asparagine synthase (glutamine-hydrolysing)